MIYLITITSTLLIFGYAVAQDANCDFSQYVNPLQQYYIANPNYPNNYPPGKQCRYIGYCPAGYNCRIDCNISMPTSSGCSGDRLLVSQTGDPTLAGAAAYCGVRSFTVVSINQTISIGFISLPSSRGGLYICTLTAQPIPTTTPPPTQCRCGERKRNRIVGGTEARADEFPFAVAIIEIAINSLLCGGTIISPKHIAIAAHCVYSFRNRPSALVVLANTNDVTNRNPNNLYSIERFIIHESYNPNTFDYDIAIIVLNTAIVNAQPICLSFKYSNTNITGSRVTFLGWGLTEPGGMTSDKLRMVDVTVIDQQTCSRTESVTPRQFCTLTLGKDACQFDSGGPVVYDERTTGTLFLFGAISSGSACATTRPGINTNLTSSVLLRWILNVVNYNFCFK